VSNLTVCVTGVDPIQEAVIEYNQRRQANVLPPDIYMGLRFGDNEQDTDVTGRQQVYIATKWRFT